MQINNLTAGEHSIKVTKAGYSDWYGNKLVVANSSVYQAVIMSTIFVNETCYDGIKNQNETGVDCGGSCPACTPSTDCGNRIIETGEQCDGTNFGSQTCGSMGFDGGTLSCSDSCQIITSGCSNNTIQFQCSDGIDNDGDGLVDYPIDPDCESVSDNNEFNNNTTDITYYFSGQLMLADNFGNLSGDAPFCGSFSYDESQPLNTPAYPYMGKYALKSVLFTVNGETAFGGASNYGLIVFDHDSSGGYPPDLLDNYDTTGYPFDYLVIHSTQVSGMLGGIRLDSYEGSDISINLLDRSGTIFGSPAIPGNDLHSDNFPANGWMNISLNLFNFDEQRLTMGGEIMELSTLPIQGCVLGTIPHCGNGIIEDIEQCDGVNLGGQNCESFGFDSGNLSCSDSCQIITSNCSSIISPNEGGEIVALAIDPSIATTLYAGTSQGVFKSTDSGNNWQVINTGLNDIDIQTIAIDSSTPSTLYAGTWGGGVFRSTNSGNSWQAINTGFNNGWIKTITIDPSTPSTLYVGSHRHGVFKSINSGNSWEAIGLDGIYIKAFAIDPSTPSTLYVGSYGGVFKSTDGGDNWQAINTGLTHTSITTLAIDPSTPSTLYVGAWGVGDYFFKSTNSGNGWQEIDRGLFYRPMHILAIDPSTPSTLYAGTSGDGVLRNLRQELPVLSGTPVAQG